MKNLRDGKQTPGYGRLAGCKKYSTKEKKREDENSSPPKLPRMLFCL
jgi:hypothetical protein